jgi:hypothetical protein
MKYLINIVLVFFFTGQLVAQKNLMVEKIGSNRKYFYKTGDVMKLRVKSGDTLLLGNLLDIQDSLITISKFGSNDVNLSNIGSVYKQFAFPKRFAKTSALFGGVIFLIIATNHLINNEPVFTPDLFIISGAFVGAGLVSFSLSEKRCRIGPRWKLKVFDFTLH